MIQVKTHDENGTRIVTVGGEIDLSTSPELWKHLQRAFQGVSGLKIKMTDVSYIDSSGIAVLIQSFKLAREEKIEFSLLEPSRIVCEVARLAQLTKLFTIEGMLDE